MAEVRCPECGEVITEGGRRVYKHAVSCLHLPHVGVDELKIMFSGRKDMYARRVLELMELASKEG